MTPLLYANQDPNFTIPVQHPNRGCVGAKLIVAVYVPDVPEGAVIHLVADVVFNNYTVNAPVVCGVMPWIARVPSLPFNPYDHQPCDGLWTGSDCTPAMPYIPFTRSWYFQVSEAGNYYCALSGYAGSDAAPGQLGVWSGQTRIQAAVFLPETV
jgi:hypothetical protein